MDCIFELAHCLTIIILKLIEFGEGAMQVDFVVQLLSKIREKDTLESMLARVLVFSPSVPCRCS